MQRNSSYLYVIFFFLISVFNAVAADSIITSKNIIFINSEQAFGFPEKKFLHPYVSPDDKWVVYHRTDINWHKQKLSEFLFGRIRDIVWEKIFYSEVGRSDNKSLPLPLLQDGNQYRIVGGDKKWSPNGKILAFSVEKDIGGSGIVLVDFSKEKPTIISSLEANWNTKFFFIAPDELLYINDQLMKKKIGRPPIKILSLIGRYPDVQIGSNGTVLYRSSVRDNYVVHMDNFIKPLKMPKQIFQEPKFDLSPTGHLAIFYSKIMYNKSNIRKNDQMAFLVDLDSQKVIYKFIVKKDYRVRWSPMGNKFAFLGEDIIQMEKSTVPVSKNYHHLVIIDASNMEIKTYPGAGHKMSISWTPDGDHILCGNVIRVIRVKDGEQIGQIKGSFLAPRDTGTITPSGEYLYWKDLDTDTFFIIKNPFKKIML